jgi:KDO2-lipid IV(A) lauroyltransferase
MAKLREKTEYFGFQFLKIPFALLPRPVCLAIGRALGSLIYRIDKKHRQIALSNLKIAFGNRISETKRKEIAKASFRHFGSFFSDIIKLRHMKQDKILRFIAIDGTEHLKKALLQGKGALIFSAHLGNWEMATAPVSEIGKINVIARPLDNRLLEKELFYIRKKLGANVIYKQQAARSVLHALAVHEMVAVLIDQNTVRNQAVFVDFFGRSAATTPSLAAFHLRTEAPIVPVFCYPVPSGMYHVKIQQPLKIDVTGKEEQDILKITQLCTNIVQDQIQENPQFWLWFHDRWKTRPEGEA